MMVDVWVVYTVVVASAYGFIVGYLIGRGMPLEIHLGKDVKEFLDCICRGKPVAYEVA